MGLRKNEAGFNEQQSGGQYGAHEAINGAVTDSTQTSVQADSMVTMAVVAAGVLAVAKAMGKKGADSEL